MVATHLLCISISAWCFSGSSSFVMRLSHLSFHMRNVDSDMRILYNLFFPCWCTPSSVLKSAMLHPRIVPYLSSGQVSCFFSHISLVSFQTISCPGALHFRRMCSMDSSSIHIGQCALCSNPGMLFQYFPHLCALCIDFHRNSLMLLVMSLLLIDLQMVLLVGSLPLRVLVACLVMSRFIFVPVLA